MANLRAEPKQLAGAARCGARARTTGQPCRSPAVRGKARCRMHGARSGGPTGSRNGAYKDGLHTREAKAAGKYFRSLVREAEALVALAAAGGRKPPKALRRRTHVRKALAEARAKKEQPR